MRRWIGKMKRPIRQKTQFSLVYVLINLVVDVVYVLLDPRIRL